MVTRTNPRLIFLIAAAVLWSQEPTIRVDVQQVLVPVVVTDKKGHHVTGLHASDFRILEDGVEQKIASFSSDTAASAGDIGALSNEAAPGRSDPASAPAAPRHTFVICLDTLHASRADAPRVRAALESLFGKEKSAGAQYVLMAIGRQMRVLEPATTDPLAIEVKIRSAGFENAMVGPDAATLAAQLENLRIRMDSFCKRCGCGMRPRNCDSEIDTLKQYVDGEADHWAAPTKELHAQFRSVVEELALLPTGRTLILVSGGFYVDPKAELYAAVSAYLPDHPQFKLEDSANSDPDLRAALQVAADRNVIIDTIDSRSGAAAPVVGTESMDASRGATGNGGDMGLGDMGSSRARTARVQSVPGGQAPALPMEPSAAMEQIARLTGGVNFRSSGDLQKEFRSALADGRQYYLLAYTPANSPGPAGTPGKFRSITVETPGKNLTIRAKAGYWAPGVAQ